MNDECTMYDGTKQGFPVVFEIIKNRNLQHSLTRGIFGNFEGKRKKRQYCDVISEKLSVLRIYNFYIWSFSLEND